MMTDHLLSDLTHPDHPLVAGAAISCRDCQASLCLRKQVVNLALGITNEMLCLQCLSKSFNQTSQNLLERVSNYVERRDCLDKEWRRYQTVEYCPDRRGCLPKICFPASE